jgi:hypothetical protein
MGPFTMMFDESTGKGLGEYTGTYLEEYTPDEIITEAPAVINLILTVMR